MVVLHNKRGLIPSRDPWRKMRDKMSKVTLQGEARISVEMTGGVYYVLIRL